jgi:HK97 family phage portal protein
MARALFISTQREDAQIPRVIRPFKGEKAMTDEYITPEVSLTVPAVLAAFTIISEDIASLPLLLYAQRGRNKFRAFDNPYYRLMKDRPNEEHTSMIFREIMLGHLLGWGNFYGQLVTDQRGTVTEIYPLRPDKMDVKRVDGQKVYIYTNTQNVKRTFLKDEILHIPAFGFDGMVGYSRIALMRNAIGLARASENFGSKFFKNDARPGTVLMSKKKMTPEGIKNLRESFTEVYAGQENRWKVAVLEEDMSIETIGIPPEDAQFLQTRTFQLGEIARAFRVPPHLIGDTERNTSWGTGIDSQEQGYVTHTLRPWTTRIEESLNSQVLLESDKDYFFEHLFADLLRGDLSTRYEAYVKAINNGIMSPNEARSRENMNPYNGGDAFMRPANMVLVTGGGSNVPTPVQDPAANSALQPLWKDALNRVVKRELNDLNGAAKRYLAKDQTPAFQEWCKKFYGKDHAQFMAQQFAPLLDAHRELFSQAPDLTEMIGAYLSNRWQSVEGMSAADIETQTPNWQADIPARLLAQVWRVVQEEMIA